MCRYSLICAVFLFFIQFPLAGESYWGGMLNIDSNVLISDEDTQADFNIDPQLLFSAFSDTWVFDLQLGFQTSLFGSIHNSDTVTAAEHLLHKLPIQSLTYSYFINDNITVKTGKYNLHQGYSRISNPLNLFSSSDYYSIFTGSSDTLNNSRWLFSASVFGDTVSVDFHLAPFIPLITFVPLDSIWLPRKLEIPERIPLQNTILERKSFAYQFQHIQEKSLFNFETMSFQASVSGTAANTLNWKLIGFHGLDMDFPLKAEGDYTGTTFSAEILPSLYTITSFGASLSGFAGSVLLFTDLVYPKFPHFCN